MESIFFSLISCLNYFKAWNYAVTRPMNLQAAAQRGLIEEVQRFIREPDCNINALDALTGCSALHLATLYNHHAVVFLLLEDPRINANQEDHEKRIPLHWAACQTNRTVLTKLANVSTINMQDENGTTPLDMAIYSGNHEAFDFLFFDCLARVDLKDKKMMTPLHHAVRAGNITVVKWLKDRIDVNAQDYRGFTALHLAVMKGFFKIASELLLNPNTQVNLQDQWAQTPFHWAVQLANSRESKKKEARLRILISLISSVNYEVPRKLIAPIC